MSGERQRPGPAPERLDRAIPVRPGFGDGDRAEAGEERDGTGGRSGGRDDPRYSDVGRLTRRSGSNFYYAFLVLPKGKREAIYAVYALARAVDDAVDEAPSPQAARQRLALWEAEVARLESGTPAHPIVQAVARARERFPIPLRSIGALLEGARMDIDRRRYESFAELRGYCENVASAIGHMCIEIFGYRSPRTREYATNLGIALQLTNILRDLGQDSRRGRLYLPLEDLRRFGAREEDLHAGRRTREVMELLVFEARRARDFYGHAEAALDPCDRRAMMSAEIMRRIYQTLLAAIEASSFDVFDRQIRLSRARRAAVALGTWLRSSLGSAPPPAGP